MKFTKELKSNKGITLIALVITIILLIILAAITINMLFGENGIIDKAKRGVENYQVAAENERKVLDGLMAMDEDMAGSTKFGTDTSNATWDPNKASGEAKLDLGETVNLRLKKVAALANGVSEDVVDTYTVYNSQDTYINKIEWWSGSESAVQKVKYGQLAMTSDSVLGVDSDGTTNELIVSDVPIWAWYVNGTIYIWSSDTTLQMHPHSERMFQGMKNLTNISDLTHFIPDNVTTVRCMFKDTKISNFTVCNNWNLLNVKTSLKNGQESLPGNNGFYWMCNATPSNSHPNFTRLIGTWDNEGTFHIGNTVTNATYSFGDEVKIGGEHFYVLYDSGSSEDTVTLIAKYNLNYEGTKQECSSNTEVPFSNEDYWIDEYDEYYGYNPNAEVDDQNPYYMYSVDCNSVGRFNLNNVSGAKPGDAMYKVKEYTKRITRDNTNETGRLLTFEEATSGWEYNEEDGSWYCSNEKRRDVILGRAGHWIYLDKDYAEEGNTDNYLFYMIASATKYDVADWDYSDNKAEYSVEAVCGIRGHMDLGDDRYYEGGSHTGVRPVLTAPKSIVSKLDYSVGQFITLGEDTFLVIEDSTSTDNTVKLLSNLNIETTNYTQEDMDYANMVNFDSSTNVYANSSIKREVDNYKSALERRSGKTIQEARLMSIEELNNIVSAFGRESQAEDVYDCFYGNFWLIDPDNSDPEPSAWCLYYFNTTHLESVYVNYIDRPECDYRLERYWTSPLNNCTKKYTLIYLI